MTDRQLLINVYITQSALFVLAGIGGFFLFEDWTDVLLLVDVDLKEIIMIGGSAAFVIVSMNIILTHYLPKSWLDDGGLNERVFRKLSLLELTILCLVVSMAEELLFRLVIQTAFGLIVASAIFAFIHFRYLAKPVLFFSVLIASFLLGIFLWTGNILITIVAHFLINFILGMFVIRQYG